MTGPPCTLARLAQSGIWIIQIDDADVNAVNGGDIGGDFTASIAVVKAIVAALYRPRHDGWYSVTTPGSPAASQ